MKTIKISSVSSIILSSFFLLSISLLVWSCDVDDTQTLEERSYSLVWSDEFDGAAGQSVEANNWNTDIGRGQDGWGNQELQYYTDRPENLALDGEGNLVITALKEAFSGAPFTSARINTQGKFSQKYGRFEARIKTPYGPGIWPAFWMRGSNFDEVSWPQCGEIDLMELRGQQPSIINATIHGPGYSAGGSITKSFGLSNDRFDKEFHIFAIEWGEDFIEFFVDDTLFQRITPEDVPGEWVYDHEFDIILNLAVGGNYVGFPTGLTPFPQHYIVDYVRVYN